jgi:3-oxoacyl-[acyl-carrier protein] reductase
MKARAWGRIVNLTSGSLWVPTPSTGVAYKTSKGAVVGFTRALAADLAPFGITVNATSPALTQVPASESNSLLVEMMQRQLIKRFAVPDDVVGIILFLTSEDSYFVTGQTVLADGGLVSL